MHPCCKKTNLFVTAGETETTIVPRDAKDMEAQVQNVSVVSDTEILSSANMKALL